VLDVIIDIFAGHALTHYTFFVELLRLMPWALPSSESQYDRKARGALPPIKIGQYEAMEFNDIIRIAEKGLGVPEDPQAPTSCVPARSLVSSLPSSRSDASSIPADGNLT
jgi:THO complex subunit 2 N-terminus